MEILEQIPTYLMRVMEWIVAALTQYGVPEQYLQVSALGVLYLGATLLVLLLVLLLRGRRGKEKELPGKTAGERLEEVMASQEEAVAEEARALEEEVEAEEEKPEVAEEVAELPAEVPAPVAEPVLEEKPQVEVPAVKPLSLFERMKAGLAKTQASVVGRIDSLLKGSKGLDDDLLEELEEILITADFGMKTTQSLVLSLAKKSARGEASTPEAIRLTLKQEILQALQGGEARPLDLESVKPFVILVTGVNGVGKTTTIGKLARQFSDQGKKVILGAGDTFRAAAAEQLTVWAERSNVEIVRHAEGADPAAVAFDTAKAAVARKADVMILDTAGRLHNKANLMEELKKIYRVLGREIPGAPHETLLVLDATTGQNALVQARLFKEAVDVSGIALTKLDGTAKGGIVVAIAADLGVPVRYVGIGEGVEDLRPFDPALFVDALFK